MRYHDRSKPDNALMIETAPGKYQNFLSLFSTIEPINPQRKEPDDGPRHEQRDSNPRS